MQRVTWIWPASYAFTTSEAGASLATLAVVIVRHCCCCISLSRWTGLPTVEKCLQKGYHLRSTTHMSNLPHGTLSFMCMAFATSNLSGSQSSLLRDLELSFDILLQHYTPFTYLPYVIAHTNHIKGLTKYLHVCISVIANTDCFLGLVHLHCEKVRWRKHDF
jgi:hypothetical protein